MRTSLIGLALGLLTATAIAAETPADLVIRNAKVYTVDTAKPRAQAVAIGNGRITAVGDDKSIARFIGASTKVVDANGTSVLPGFIDGHIHPLFGGISRSQCYMVGAGSIDAYVKIVTQCIADTPGTGLIYGVGWEGALFPPSGIPNKDILDKITSTRPIVLQSNDGHSRWVNSAALKMAGITKDTPNPPNGVIDRDPKTKEPVGALQEAAMDLMDPFIPPPTPKQMQDAILYTQSHVHALGVTTWHDAGVDVAADGASPVLEAYKALRDRDALSMHVALALKWDNARGLEQLPVLLKTAERARQYGFQAKSVKLYLDGVIPQYTAAMIAPYADKPGEKGSLQISPQVLEEAVTALDKAGFQAHIHAIGDGATRLALDVFERARAKNGKTDARHQISHLNVIDPQDQPRFGKLGVAPNFQPAWAVNEPYMDLTIARIGSERAKSIYPTQSLLKGGAMIVFGADWPVATANPLEGIATQMTRTIPGQAGAKPLLAAEALTLEQAIRAHTLNVAIVNHLDADTGSLAPGKSADLIVLDRDVFALTPDEIAKTKIQATVFKGKKVFGELAGF